MPGKGKHAKKQMKSELILISWRGRQNRKILLKVIRFLYFITFGCSQTVLVADWVDKWKNNKKILQNFVWKYTCNIDWLSWILSISRLSFKHVIKYSVALGIPTKRRQLPEEQSKTGKLSQIQGTAPKAVPQTLSHPSHIEHHSLLSPVINKFIFKHTLLHCLNPDLSKANGGLEAHSTVCLPIFMMCPSSFCSKHPLHHTFIPSQSQEHPALPLCLWTSSPFLALAKLMIRNVVLNWMLAHTSGKKCTGKSHMLECWMVAVQHCRDKWTSACTVHLTWRVTHCLKGFWSEAPHNWPANLLGAKANPSVSRAPSNSLLPTVSLQEHLRVYLCLPLVSREDEEILSMGEPNPGKLLFFLVSVTSFSRDTKSSRRNSLAARLVADFSSLAMGWSPTSRAAEGSRGCRRKQ